MKNKLYNKLNILTFIKNPIFEQRESGVVHTPFNEETKFYELIEFGETEKLKMMLQSFENSGINTGKLSEDPLTQVKYFAVSSITLAVRAAIRGGISDIYAYNLGDEVIRKMDKMSREEDIMEFLQDEVMKLTEIVHLSHSYNLPKGIKQCISYIDKNLHLKISILDLAKITNFSRDYAGKYFKKHMGINIKDYILKRKLEESKIILKRGETPESVAYLLGFSSQSHFIACFKKEFGITPKKYLDTIN